MLPGVPSPLLLILRKNQHLNEMETKMALYEFGNIDGGLVYLRDGVNKNTQRERPILKTGENLLNKFNYTYIIRGYKSM